ncbi:uncharacterized protein AB675_9349 [Cyphellophora attinorum]|uniref:Uncharacterized protein n=1 Tax=Cyphellophora attinorum TaxID=1664694 RepID=A0A0N1P232_9EURO|nr:uncharacterized protein AB675_9349 [Phialophora attinorum]KPI41740.1 hypothetical protein AB675_9349 [Phialophora attinorum]
MSTPQQHVPKGPRRSGKKHNKPQPAQNGPANAPRNAVSENESAVKHVQPTASTDASKPRSKSHAHNKPPVSGNASDTPVPAKSQGTPYKNLYAGPAWHNSPAASSLPIPEFYSKSVPAKQPPPIIENSIDQELITAPDAATPTKRESTPLDWMFDAERKRRDGVRSDSLAAQGAQSVPSRSPAARSPAPDSIFPLELDGATGPGEQAVTSTSSFNDRINSVKRSTSNSACTMDDTERKAKTDALKQMLFASPQKSPQPLDPNNPFNARAPQPRPYTAQPLSNPNRPSHLRYQAASETEAAELSSDSGITPPRTSTARRQANATVPTQVPPGGPVFSPPPQTQFPQYQIPNQPFPSPGAFPMGQPNSGRPPAMHPANSHGPNQQQPYQPPGYFSPPPPNSMHGQGPPQQHRHSVAAYPTGNPGGPPAKTKPTAAQMENELRSVLNLGNLNIASRG